MTNVGIRIRRRFRVSDAVFLFMSLIPAAAIRELILAVSLV